MTDFAPLLFPRPEPPKRLMMAVDILSWSLPALSAGLSIAAGLAALWHRDAQAAFFGIASGIVGALGVLFTNWTSRVRDGRLAVTHGVASVAMDTASSVDSRTSTYF